MQRKINCLTDAINEILIAQHSIGMLMPDSWIKTHGTGSTYSDALQYLKDAINYDWKPYKPSANWMVENHFEGQCWLILNGKHMGVTYVDAPVGAYFMLEDDVETFMAESQYGSIYLPTDIIKAYAIPDLRQFESERNAEMEVD